MRYGWFEMVSLAILHLQDLRLGPILMEREQEESFDASGPLPVFFLLSFSCPA